MRITQIYSLLAGILVSNRSLDASVKRKTLYSINLNDSKNSNSIEKAPSSLLQD